MFPSRNQVIRDQIHGLVPVDDGLRRIIDTPEIQRMRWIRQTGLAYLVFPCAEHSRFSHSIGAYAVAKRVFARLEALHDDLMISLFPCVSSPEKLAETGKAFAVAALCHDLGHTAFSHALEGILLPTSAPPPADNVDTKSVPSNSWRETVNLRNVLRIIVIFRR